MTIVILAGAALIVLGCIAYFMYKRRRASMLHYSDEVHGYSSNKTEMVYSDSFDDGSYKGGSQGSKFDKY